jgi:hypothetical protein
MQGSSALEKPDVLTGASQVNRNFRFQFSTADNILPGVSECNSPVGFCGIRVHPKLGSR